MGRALDNAMLNLGMKDVARRESLLVFVRYAGGDTIQRV